MWNALKSTQFMFNSFSFVALMTWTNFSFSLFSLTVFYLIFSCKIHRCTRQHGQCLRFVCTGQKFTIEAVWLGNMITWCAFHSFHVFELTLNRRRRVTKFRFLGQQNMFSAFHMCTRRLSEDEPTKGKKPEKKQQHTNAVKTKSVEVEFPVP